MSIKLDAGQTIIYGWLPYPGMTLNVTVIYV